MSAEIAAEAAHAAGRIIAEAIGSGVGPPMLPAHKKGVVDLVTRVDLASEEVIREVLGRLSPGVPILGEEGGGARGVSTRWLVDPLDGTTNFVHGFPAYAVSIGLQVDGRLEAGCVYDPLRRQTYTAERGRGAFCDGERLRVSERGELGESLLLTGFAYDRRERAAFYLRFVKLFLERSRGLRRAGAAALDLAHVACGRADGFWEFGLSAWDVAAGALLVEEAGGRVTDMSLLPLDLDAPRLLATNGRIHDEMSEILLSGLAD
ncbi:MAG: myo-inositol-1(or 4)-monophosphatase [Myxococcota bacterium]